MFKSGPCPLHQLEVDVSLGRLLLSLLKVLDWRIVRSYTLWARIRMSLLSHCQRLMVNAGGADTLALALTKCSVSGVSYIFDVLSPISGQANPAGPARWVDGSIS